MKSGTAITACSALALCVATVYLAFTQGGGSGERKQPRR